MNIGPLSSSNSGALMTCTIPDQVFETLTEEASEWGVRAAIFDVRGRAAWGASALDVLFNGEG